ncbi:hypothetical protein [Methylomonas sp. YC3]
MRTGGCLSEGTRCVPYRAEMCTYLSYDNVIEISDLKHLSHLSDKVIEEYEESAE